MNESKLSPQARKVLNDLRMFRFGGVSTWEMAQWYHVPQASVRRALGELRTAGFTLTKDGQYHKLAA